MNQTWNPFLWQQNRPDERKKGVNGNNSNDRGNPGRIPGSNGMNYLMPGSYGMYAWMQSMPGMFRGAPNQAGIFYGMSMPGSMPGQGTAYAGFAGSWTNPAPVAGGRIFPAPGTGNAPAERQKAGTRTPKGSGRDSAVSQAARKQNEENARVLDPARYRETNISLSDLSQIVSLYGSNIENIYSLSPGQKWMFDRGHTLKSLQIMQFVCRAKMDFDLPGFRENIDVVCQNNDNLRTAIVYRYLSEPYKVVLKNRGVDYSLVDFRDLVNPEDEDSVNRCINRIIDVDIKRGFDLEKDPLFRISVFRIGADEYIFLISQPHINTDGSSLGLLLKQLFMDYALELNGINIEEAESSYKDYARYMMTVDKEKELEYWKQKLDGCQGECHLPGFIPDAEEYAESEYAVTMNEELCEKLGRLQSSARATLFNILQAAWAITLRQINQTDDIVFGTVISGRNAKVKNSMKIQGGFAEILPLRVQIGENDTIRDVVRDVHISTAEAEENADCTVDEIEEYTGRTRHLFTHELNYHNFEMPKVELFKDQEMKGFHLISGSMHVSHAGNLSLVFTKSENGLLCNFHFNRNSYRPYNIKITAMYFRHLLDLIVEEGLDVKMAALPEPDRELFDVASSVYGLTTVKKVVELKKQKLLADLDDDILTVIADQSAVVGYMHGETIIEPDDMLDTVPILLNGEVVIRSGNSDEWSRICQVMTGYNILTCTALTNECAGITAIVTANNTEVIYIPKRSFLSLLEKKPGLDLRLAVIMEKQQRFSVAMSSEVL